MSGLSIHKIYKSFGATQALGGVSFSVSLGEIVAVLGPSGCGKSTLLTIIAGLVSPDRGEILWEGVSMVGTPPYRRNFGLMFQDFALFPHRNVYENVSFGLQMARKPKLESQKRVEEVLALVGLPGFGPRDVNTLSGGEQQRVALARSLAPQPRLLMLDEPLGSLDRNLRERLVTDLRKILKMMEQTAIYVTHDQEEAFTLADRVVVMNAGRVEQVGPPLEIYRQPATAFVAQFIGLDNLLEGKVRAGAAGSEVETALGTFPIPPIAQEQVTVLFRPDQVSPTGAGLFQLEGKLVEATFQGSTCRALIQANGIQLIFDFPSTTPLPPPGETIRLGFDPQQAIQVLNPGSSQDIGVG